MMFKSRLLKFIIIIFVTISIALSISFYLTVPTPQKANEVEKIYSTDSVFASSIRNLISVSSSSGELNDHSAEIKRLSLELLDTPYNLKGNSLEEGFSTATLVQYIYREAKGILLSRKVSFQQELGEPIHISNLTTGDLLFFRGTSSKMSALYLNNGHFIVATRSGVHIRNLYTDTYWTHRFIEGKRLTKLEEEKLSPKIYTDHPNLVVREAMTMLHRPYLLTGSTFAAFDCSFLVQHVFEELNVHLPRITYQQYKVGKPIPLDGAKPGDVLYFSGTWQEGISHTGIYLGDFFFIHASGEEGETTISYLGEQWKKYFTGVKQFDHLKVSLTNPTIKLAYSLLNIEYKKNGTTPVEGFNYSGLIYYIFHQNDDSFPRTSEDQWNYGNKVIMGNELPGDVFFFNTKNDTLLPALYIGNNQLVVMRKDKGVSIVDLRFSFYWTKERVARIRRYPKK